MSRRCPRTEVLPVPCAWNAASAILTTARKTASYLNGAPGAIARARAAVARGSIFAQFCVLPHTVAMVAMLSRK